LYYLAINRTRPQYLDTAFPCRRSSVGSGSIAAMTPDHRCHSRRATTVTAMAVAANCLWHQAFTSTIQPWTSVFTDWHLASAVSMIQKGKYAVLLCCVAEALTYRDNGMCEMINLLFNINSIINPIYIRVPTYILQ
jgi:hypothetical protein